LKSEGVNALEVSSKHKLIYSGGFDGFLFINYVEKIPVIWGLLNFRMLNKKTS
jgi:hypothetical protein